MEDHLDGHSSDSSDILRRWDLNSNSTRYDRLRAAPSDHDLRIMWITWSVILFVMSCVTFVLLIAIGTAPAKVRKNAFNTYLFYLVMPDFLFSVGAFITATSNAIVGHYISDWMCQVQHFYLAVGVGGNTWLNATVAFQLYRLLRKSKFPQFKRQYKPPTHKDARRHSLLVYLGVIAVSCLYYIPIPGDPLEIVSHKGMFCLAGEGSRTSSLTFWLVMLPSIVLVPLGIVLWTSFQVIRYNMLPMRGRRRALAVFFTRLLFVFVIMWMPAILFIFIGGTWGRPWLAMGGATWSLMQSGASALAALSKDDIRKAVLDLLFCRSREEQKEAYRVAVQSVSAVLENDESTHDDIQKYDDIQNQEVYPEEALIVSKAKESLHAGDPNAYWPSQRPKRINPRLARFLEEQGEDDGGGEPSVNSTASGTMTSTHEDSTAVVETAEHEDQNNSS